MKVIVVDKHYGSIHAKKLEQLQEDYVKVGISCTLEHFSTEDEIIVGCMGAQAILATGNPPITQKVIQALPGLRIIQRFGIGVNSVDLEAASQLGVVVMNMPNFCVEELATHAASLILSLIRNTAYYDRCIRKGLWPKAQYFEPRNLGELTLGLFGFGGSARPLYRILHNGFGTKVLACDPYVTEETKAEYYNVTFTDFHNLLSHSDIISIHAPLTRETEGVFNRNSFRIMKNDAMIINVSRGGVVNELDLIEALRQGNIRFAGLDVFDKEPLPENSPLKEMDNVLLTCHSAFYGDTAQATQLTLAYNLVSQALLEQKLDARYIANKTVIRDLRGYQVIE